jgi:hypothetical protein
MGKSDRITRTQKMIGAAPRQAFYNLQKELKMGSIFGRGAAVLGAK